MQILGMNYDETYASVVYLEVTINGITVMLDRNAYIDLVDFETAFLNGYLNE